MDLGHVIESALIFLKTHHYNHESVRDAIETAIREAPFRKACQALLDAPHHDHFASRLSDEELNAVNTMKQLLNDDEDYTATLHDA